MSSRGCGVGVLLVGQGMPKSNGAKDLRSFVTQVMDCRQVVPAGLFGRVRNRGSLKAQARDALVPALESFWTPQGWPYDLDCMRLTQGLNGLLSESGAVVRFGMHLGDPSIADGVHKLTALGCDSLLVLPLDSHIAPPFLGLVKARVRDAAEKARFHGPISFVEGYSANPLYLRALAASILNAGFSAQRQDQVLLLYPSLCKDVLHGGEDQLRSGCARTLQAVAGLLGVEESRVDLAFYRPFGSELDWIGPFAQDVVEAHCQDGGSGGSSAGGRLFLAWPGVSVDGALHRFDLGRPIVGDSGAVEVPALGRSRANLKVLCQVIREAMERSAQGGR